MKKNWIIDAALFVGFVLSFFLDVTGVVLHQWLGLALGALAVYHLWAHWTWVCSVTQRLVAHASARVRLCWLVDACLASGFVLITASGLVISSWLDLSLENYHLWSDFHVAISIMTLGLIVLKVGLHWRWITNTFNTQILLPQPSASGTSATSPMTPATPPRRAFLGLMGMVSLAAIAAIISIHESVHEEREETAPAAAQPDNTKRVLPALESTSQPLPASSDCVARCDNGCPYPGDCRRYRDANGNGYCDRGECL